MAEDLLFPEEDRRRGLVARGLDPEHEPLAHGPLPTPRFRSVTTALSASPPRRGGRPARAMGNSASVSGGGSSPGVIRTTRENRLGSVRSTRERAPRTMADADAGRTTTRGAGGLALVPPPGGEHDGDPAHDALHPLLDRELELDGGGPDHEAPEPRGVDRDPDPSGPGDTGQIHREKTDRIEPREAARRPRDAHTLGEELRGGPRAPTAGGARRAPGPPPEGSSPRAARGRGRRPAARSPRRRPRAGRRSGPRSS